MRLAEACRGGQVAAAELELHEWHRQPDCPPTACVLLAALLARRGQLEHASAILHAATQDDLDHDAAIPQMLVAVLIASDLTDAARRAAQRLHHRHGYDPAIATWLQAMQVPGYEQLPPVTDATVDHLAAELVVRLDVLPSLVAAQKIRANLKDVQLLRSVIQRIDRHVTGPRQRLMLCQAMADLSMLAGDTDEARRWAHRGLKLDPYSAALALVLSRISDDAGVGPPATDVLARSLDAHPTYADLRAAMIRRQHTDGKTDTARLRLTEWLDREPQHPLAHQLQQELAA
ncbi:MAG: hypothetical protein V3U29_07000 [Phycisphaeraceae bacterium]